MHSREGAPIFVLLEREVPKKSTEVPMMTTRFTTLQTPCETGLTRDRVLKANCVQQPEPQHPDTEEPHTFRLPVMLCLAPFSLPFNGRLQSCRVLRCSTHQTEVI